MKHNSAATSSTSAAAESLLQFLRQRVRAAYMAVPAAFALGFTPIARAASFDWDPTVTGGVTLGGAGIWDATAPNRWWDGTNNVPWANGLTDVAVFGGLTGGTVTITTGSGVSANGLTFNTDGYVISGATAGDSLTLIGTTPTITVGNVAHTATISAVLAGTVGFEKTGAGRLVLSGANTISGSLVISAGTLRAVSTGAGTTVTATGVTTAAANNPLGSATLSLNGGTLELAPLATVNQNGLSGRVFGAAPLNNDSTQVNFTAAATSTRWDANLNRFDLTTVSGGGTAITPTTNVSAQWLGKLNISTAGVYRFFGAADDGIRVFIDGVLSVNNDGSKGTTDLGGAGINLSAGLHDIRVEYTQGAGGGAAILSWAGATAGLDAPLTETAIPTTSLFTAESNSTAASSNAVIMGAGVGSAVNVAANSTINLNGTQFTQAQLGGLTNTTGTALTVSGLAGKTLRFAGNSTITGTLTLINTPDVAIDGVLGGVGATLIKQGTGRLVFAQTTAVNTIDAASLIDVQAGTAVLLGLSGGNNPIGNAGIQLSGGNLLLDSKGGGATYDNVITVTENATIQDIVAGVGPVVTTLGSAARGISIASGKTLTFDAITGANNLANNPTQSTQAGAQITVAGAITGAGNLNAISTSFGNNITPGVVALGNAGNTFGGNITINGTTITTNTVLSVNGPTLRPTAAGALPANAGNAIFVKSGVLDFATSNVAYTPNAANVVTLGGGPAFTTSAINIGTGVFTLTNDVVFDATNNAGVGSPGTELEFAL